MLSHNHLKAKLGATLLGMAIVVGGASPQTSANLERYLVDKGYSDVVVLGPAADCGGIKRKWKYKFRAKSPTGGVKTGSVCMADYWFGYTLTEDRSGS